MYGLEPILETMLNVSIVIPAWNEQERINDCLLNATRQTVMPHEVIVVDNRSTDSTVAVVEQFMKDHPEAPVKLLHQDDEQGLIPTRDYGLNHATGDILGRFDADCMIRPDWVEVVSGIFTEDPDAMGATGPVMYYDLPSRHFGLRGDAYMLLGLAGLPIFSEGGGIWYIFKPSFGYIIGFCLGTYVTGLIAERLKQKTVFRYLLANLAGLMIVYICGMVYYYVICNYVIDTPIGIWPLILYCFLLAVPGDIALSVLGAVIAKRVRPVVHQYLFDAESNVRLKTEELAK